MNILNQYQKLLESFLRSVFVFFSSSQIAYHTRHRAWIQDKFQHTRQISDWNVRCSFRRYGYFILFSPSDYFESMPEVVRIILTIGFFSANSLPYKTHDMDTNIQDRFMPAILLCRDMVLYCLVSWEFAANSKGCKILCFDHKNNLPTFQHGQRNHPDGKVEIMSIINLSCILL